MYSTHNSHQISAGFRYHQVGCIVNQPYSFEKKINFFGNAYVIFYFVILASLELLPKATPGMDGDGGVGLNWVRAGR